MKCECGCGQETDLAKAHHKKFGHVKGQPLRYRLGHSSLKRGGWKHSAETRAKMSAKASGAGNPSWKGGITPEHVAIRNSTEYREWARQVRARDSYTCQRCGKRGHTVHHIKSFADYPELRTVLENGLTLCTKCHKAVHDQT